MQLLGKVIILFLIIFNFRIPGFHSSAVLCLILMVLYYIFIRKSVPFHYFFKKYNFSILIGLLIVLGIASFITMVHSQYEFTLVKVLTLQFFMLSTLIFALPVIIDDTRDDTFEQAINIICHTFALQGLIQLLGFLIPPFGDFLISTKPEGMQAALLDGPYNIYFRGYSLTGSPFFELPAGFGVATILFIRLIFIENQRYITGYRKYVIPFLFLVGSMLSGRTAFIGVGLGVIMAFFFVKNFARTLLKVGKILILFSVLGAGVYLFVLSSSQRRAITDDILPFAFEFYYNYKSTGEFTTVSTDALVEHHYFPLSQNTLLHGDGRYVENDGAYYGRTDAGYMRALLYGGVPFLLCLIIYQSLYFISPLAISKTGNIKDDRADFICFLILFLHLFILEYKADTIGTQNIMQVLLLFLGTGYITRYYYRLESVE